MNRRLGMLAVLSLAAAPAAAQGVMIAPTAIFIDHASRSGSVLLAELTIAGE